MLITVTTSLLAALAVYTALYARVTNQRLKLIEHMMQGLMVASNLNGENMRKAELRLQAIEAKQNSEKPS